MKILIADAGNPKNLGNILALNSIKKLIKSVDPEAKIIIHSSFVKNRDMGITRFWNQSLFSYLMMAKANSIIRFLRLSRLVKHILSGKHPPLPRKDIFLTICHDYWQSDVVVFASGSGFSTKDLIKDTLRLLVNYLIIKYAKLGGRKVIIMPTGYGPFKYSFQAGLAWAGVKDASLVFVRDNNSYQLLKRSTNKVVNSLDPVLFLNTVSGKVKNQKELKIGVTFRNWESQTFENFEIELAETFYQLAKFRQISFYPILIDHDKFSPEYSFYKIFDKYTRSCGIKIGKAKEFSNFSDVTKYIRKLDFLISLRTNSTLLAVSSGIPFVAFSKHQKVKLLLKDVHLKNYFLSEFGLNTQEGKEKLISFVVSSGKQKPVLKKIKNEIMKKERRKLINILSKTILTYSDKNSQVEGVQNARLSTLV